MKNFDGFVGVDWSGAKNPVRTLNIAVAICDRENPSPKLVKNADTAWSREAVLQWLVEQAVKNKRLLVGIDCNFGYARSVGQKQFGRNYTYRDLWRAVENANLQNNNFFAGGFWENPRYSSAFWTTGKMPKGFTMPKRETEHACHKTGYGTPESPFKLIGAKQVGKGGLAGMRMLMHLKAILGNDLAIWPFENDTDGATLVITEIYPRFFIRKAGYGTKKITDNKDVYSILSHFGADIDNLGAEVSDHEADAVIAAAGLYDVCGSRPYVPENFSNPENMSPEAALQEGWIFGVP